MSAAKPLALTERYAAWERSHGRLVGMLDAVTRAYDAASPVTSPAYLAGMTDVAGEAAAVCGTLARMRAKLTEAVTQSRAEQPHDEPPGHGGAE